MQNIPLDPKGHTLVAVFFKRRDGKNWTAGMRVQSEDEARVENYVNNVENQIKKVYWIYKE